MQNTNNTNVTLNLNDLAALSVKELRKLAIERKVASGVWIQGATKAQLIHALTTGNVPYAPAPDAAASAATLAEAIESILKNTASPLDESRVREIASEVLAETDRPRRIEIVHPDQTIVNVESQHQQFDRVLKYVIHKKPVMLVGPVGAGKTTAVEKMAEGLKLPFYPQSVTTYTTESKFFGQIDANGVYRPSLFRKAFEEGGIYLLDEVDKGNPNALAALNSASSNGYASFPDRVVKAHPDFRFVASGNTWGLGRNADFVGSNQLDASTINRFARVEWGYDEKLETRLAEPFGQPEWVQFVQKVRHTIDKLGIRHIVSPRASINGAEMIAAGQPRQFVEEDYVWAGLDKASIDKIKANLAA